MAAEMTTTVETKTEFEAALKDLSLADKVPSTNLKSTPNKKAESPRKVVQTQIQFYGGPLGVAPEPMIIGGYVEVCHPLSPLIYSPMIYTPGTRNND